MDNRRNFKMALTLMLLLISIVAIVNAKATQEEKQHLPIEILFSPLKTTNKVSDSSFDNNISQRKNENFQLKILSTDDNESKLDLIVSSTKEVQATEKSIDAYSPTYNGEKKIANEDFDASTKDGGSSAKAFETSRKDPNNLYQSSENDLFSSPHKLSEMSHHFMNNRNEFSPLETLKHLEKNLEKEMQPRYLEQALTTLQYMNSEVPYGMMLPQPMFSGDYAPMFHSVPKPSTNHMQNPNGYYDPHQRQMPPNTLVHRYPVDNGTPQSNSAMNPYYSYMNPVSQPIHSGPQPQINMKDLSRDPRYNSESGYRTISPEQKTLLQTSSKPEHNSQYNPQYLPMGMHKEHATHSSYPESNQQNYRLPHNHRIPNDLNYPHSGSQRQVKDEVHDRNLFYTPLPDKYQRFEHKNPAYMSDNFHRPIDNQQNLRTTVMPQRDHHESIHHNAMNGLRSQIPMNYPKDQQVPRYTLVPQNLLPKYLQTPVYQQQSSGSDTETHPISAERAKFQHHPHNEERYRSSQMNTSPRHKLEMKHLDSPPEHSLSPVHRRYPNQMSSVPHRHVNPKEHQNHYSEHSQSAESHIPQNDNSPYSYPVGQKEYPTSPVSSYHAKSQDSQREYPEPSHHQQRHHGSMKSEEYKANNENNQSAIPKRRKKYKSSNFENGSLPYKRNIQKGLKSQFNDNNDDLNSHASHQYVIKIG